jgi:hypothetical protein
MILNLATGFIRSKFLSFSLGNGSIRGGGNTLVANISTPFSAVADEVILTKEEGVQALVLNTITNQTLIQARDAGLLKVINDGKVA